MPAIPYMRLYVGDYLGDTSHLTAIQHGAYLLLIMAYWQRGGPLRNTDVLLSNIARTTPEEWQKCKEVVLEFFTEVDGLLYHKRIDAELHKTADISSKCRDAISKRWYGRNTDVIPPNNGRNTTPISSTINNINNIPKENGRNTDVSDKAKHKYGSESNVMLTDAQYSKLVADLGEPMATACIEELSQAKAMKGYAYKRDDLAIRKWVIAAVNKKGPVVAPLPTVQSQPPHEEAILCPVCQNNETTDTRMRCRKCGFMLVPDCMNDPEIVAEYAENLKKASADA